MKSSFIAGTVLVSLSALPSIANADDFQGTCHHPGRAAFADTGVIARAGVDSGLWSRQQTPPAAPATSGKRPMKIGELAQRAHVNIDTVRYYEKHGLLPTPQRLASGYRLYDESDVARLRFVRRAKTLGFTLVEIRELLDLSGRREDDMAGLKATAMEKLADVETRLAELSRIRDGLKTLVASCPGHGALVQCPILNALAEGNA
jgi:MerR family transcriptional regulator, copper efflux regulator